MVKKSLLMVCVFLFLFSLPGLVVGEQVIKEGWFSYNDAFIVGDSIYEILLNPASVTAETYDSLLFKKDSFRTLVSVGDCKSDDDGFNYCFVEYSLDSPKADITPEGRLVPGIRIRITRDKDQVGSGEVSYYSADVKSSESGNKILFSEQEAIITVTNTGLRFIGAELVIVVPDGINITSRGDFAFSLGNLKFPLTMDRDEEKTLSFKYEVISVGAKKFDYELSRQGESLKKNSFSVIGKEPYSFEVVIPSKADLKSSNVLSVKIKNLNPSEELVVSSLDISGSGSIAYSALQNLVFTRVGVYSAKKNAIPPSSERIFSLRFSPQFSGVYPLKVSALLEQNNRVFSEEKVGNVTVSAEGVSAVLRFSRKNIVAGAHTDVSLIVKNDHSSLSFNDFVISLDSELFSDSAVIDSLGPGQSRTLFSKRLVTPLIDENKDYEFDVDVRFKNAAGQVLSLQSSDVLDVTGDGVLFRVDQSVSKSRASAGDEIIVEVFVTNLKDNNFNRVVVKDLFSQQVKLVVGRASSSINFLGGQKQRSYLYKIRVPDKPVSSNLEIKTLVSLSDGYELSKSYVVKIDGDIFESEAQVGVWFDESSIISDLTESDEVVDDGLISSVEDLESDDLIVEEVVKEKGFLSRLFSNMGDFFANLFGKK